MKRIAFATVVLSAAAAGAGYSTYPDEFMQYVGVAAKAALRVWESVEANPGPYVFALSTFVLTVLYHKARGKTLRESVDVAVTRISVVPAPIRDPAESENPVVRRAKARATRTQLMSDLIGIQNRSRKLPEEILKGEKEVCYAEQARDEAEEKLANKQEAYETSVARLEALRKEKSEGDTELAAIESEMKKLADVA